MNIILSHSTFVSFGRIPKRAIFEPLYILSIISSNAFGDPDISSPISNPTIPRESMVSFTFSPFDGLIVRVAPIFFAISRRESLRSLTTIYLAPAKRHMATAMLPIRPAPVISTSSPITGNERAV